MNAEEHTRLAAGEGERLPPAPKPAPEPPADGDDRQADPGD